MPEIAIGARVVRMHPAGQVGGVQHDETGARELCDGGGGRSHERACGQDEKDRDDRAEAQGADTRLDIIHS